MAQTQSSEDAHQQALQLNLFILLSTMTRIIMQMQRTNDTRLPKICKGKGNDTTQMCLQSLCVFSTIFQTVLIYVKYSRYHVGRV